MADRFSFLRLHRWTLQLGSEPPVESPDRCRPRPRPDRAVQVLGSSSYSSRPSTRSSARAIRRLGKARYAEKLHERSTSPSDSWNGISRAGLGLPVACFFELADDNDIVDRPATMLREWLWPWRLVSLRVGWCPLVAGGRRLCAACGASAGVRCVHAAWQGSRCQATWGAGPRPPRLGPAALGAVRRAGGSPLGRAQPRW